MFYCGRKEIMDSNFLETENVTGYCVSIVGTNGKTSVALTVTRKDGEPLELASNDDVSEARLDAICDALDML